MTLLSRRERERLKIHTQMLSSLCQQFGKDTGYLPSPLFAYVDIKWFPKSAANEGDRGFSREPSDGCAVIQLLALPSLPPSLCCSPEAQLLPWQAFPCTHTGRSQLQASPADNKVNQTTPYLSITDTSLSQSTHVPHVSSPAASQHPPEKERSLSEALLAGFVLQSISILLQ